MAASGDKRTLSRNTCRPIWPTISSRFIETTLVFAQRGNGNLFDVIIKQGFAERPQICDFAVALMEVRDILNHSVVRFSVLRLE